MRLRHDFGFAARRLRQSKAFVFFSVTTLALGVASVSTGYALVSALLLQPPALDAPERVVNVYHVPLRPGAPAHEFYLSWLDYQDLRVRQTVFTELSASVFLPVAVSTARAEMVLAEVVDGHYFDLVRFPPAAGRLIQVLDTIPSAPRVAVISTRLWQRTFGGDASVLGSDLRINGHVFTIVGVAAGQAKGVSTGAARPVDVWVPLTHASAFWFSGDLADRNSRALVVKGRLRGDLDTATAAVEVRHIGDQLDIESPLPRQRNGQVRTRRFSVEPVTNVYLHESMDWFAMPLGVTTMGFVVLGLVVACTSLGTLMLVRALDRKLELAIRLSLGASRGRVVWQVVVESLVLCALGGPLGIGLCLLLVRALTGAVHLAPGLVLPITPQVDIAVLAVALAATMLTMLVAGVVPAVRALRAGERQGLTRAASDARASYGRGRRLAIALQVAVSVALLTTTAAFVHRLVTLASHDPGIDLDRIATARLSVRHTTYSDEQLRVTADRLIETIGAHPAVTSVSLMTDLPIHSAARFISLRETPAAIAEPPMAAARTVMYRIGGDEHVAGTLGLHLLAGRTISGVEHRAGARVIVLTESAAQRVFDEVDVVGRTVYVPDDPAGMTVIGVVAEMDVGTYGTRDRPAVFTPLVIGRSLGHLSVVAKGVDGAAVLPAIHAALDRVAPDLPVEDAATGAQLRGRTQEFTRLGLAAFGGAGVLAGILSLVGLYGLVAYVVARRTREYGIRVALGASPGRLRRDVWADSLAPALGGAVCGGLLAAGGLAAFRAIALIEVSWHPLAMVAAPLLLVSAAAAATWRLACRAARVEPNVALREL